MVIANLDTDPQCFKYYNGVFDKTQGIGRKENNPLPSKEDKWIIRVMMTRKEVERIVWVFKNNGLDKEATIQEIVDYILENQASGEKKSVMVKNYSKKDILD